MAKHREIPEEVPSEFVYLLTKAELYVKIGPDRYRKTDAGKMPPQDWSPEELRAVQTGMEQICQFRGWARDRPFEDLGVGGFYALLATLHFELEQQQALAVDESTFVDEMHMRHRMTGQTVVLYNLVS